MLNRSARIAMSTSDLKALPGKFDIKRHSPSILHIHVSYCCLFSFSCLHMYWVCCVCGQHQFFIKWSRLLCRFVPHCNCFRAGFDCWGHWRHRLANENIRTCGGQYISKCLDRPPDKSAYWKIIFFISHPKHMLWVLKRTVSMWRFFWAPKTHEINGWENNYDFTQIKIPYLDLC